MAVAQKNSSEVSRRGLLTGGLAGGFLLAFHLPVRAANEPVQPPDVTEGKFAPNAFIRIDSAGKTTLVMPQVEMGQGVYTSIPMILGRRTRCRFLAGGAAARAAERQALRQSYVRPAGYRQFQLHPRVLDAVAQCRRKRARHAGAGRRAAMAGRAGELHHVERRSHASAERAQTFLWRAGGCGGQPDAAQGRPAQGSQGLCADRQAAEAARHAGQDQRQSRLWHRRDASRHEVRDAGGVSGVRRQGRQGRRQRRQENPGRTENHRAGRSRRGGRRSHVGGEERPRSPGRDLGRRR